MDIRYVRSGSRELVISVDTEATLQTVTDIIRALGASEVPLDPAAVVGDRTAATSRSTRKSVRAKKGSVKKAPPAKKITAKAAAAKKVSAKRAAPAKNVSAKKAASAKRVTAKKGTAKKATGRHHRSESSATYATPVSHALTRGGDDLGPMIRKKK